MIVQEKGIFVKLPKKEEFDIQKYDTFVTLTLGEECLLTPIEKELGPNSPTLQKFQGNFPQVWAETNTQG